MVVVSGAGSCNKEPFHPDLVRKLIARIISREEALRISEEALVAAGELLGLFVLEAKDRASVEAECDHEATLDDNCEEGDCDTENFKDNGEEQAANHHHNYSKKGNLPVPIRADHVTKIAADLIFDFTT